MIYQSFNEMSGRLGNYINENYLKTIELQRAELKQLQAQIDPHFLYNTLFILQSRIRRKDFNGGAKLAGLLGEYFRFINRGNKDFVTLEAEVAHTRTYIEIQKERFTQRFNFIFEELPSEYKDVVVPRLIIQPIVENSIEYGLKDTENDGIISITYKTIDEKFFIIVEDSGKISDSDIEKMNRNLNNLAVNGDVSSTINIIRRLKLFYGEGYGMTFERSLIGGLKAVLEIDKNMKGEPNNESAGS